jgi:hypothetical protein
MSHDEEGIDTRLCPHYQLGFEHEKNGITIREAIERELWPDDDCACYFAGRIEARDDSILNPEGFNASRTCGCVDQDTPVRCPACGQEFRNENDKYRIHKYQCEQIEKLKESGI